jgi:2-dehydropantoate 2-reductase
MKVCIYGCGAIGSLIAARLSHGGADVSAVARGPHLQAMLEHGLTLVPADGDHRINARIAASEQPADLGVQDVVFLTLKSHMLPDIAAAIDPLLGPDTLVVTACNGMPWWYSYGLDRDYGIAELDSVDPGGKLWHSIGPERAIGCAVYPAARISEPGIVQHVFGDRFSLGEPDGSASERLSKLAELMRAGGFDITLDEDIRANLWTKLVANAAYNPVSLVTGKTLGEMIDDEATNGLLVGIMREATAVAESLGVTIPVTPEQLIEVTRQLGNHKTSMLQDFEVGRSLELGPIVQAVTEIGKIRGVPTRSLDMIYGLALAKVRQPSAE